MRNFISSVFAFLIISILPFSTLASFSDIENNHQFLKSIQWMQDRKIINGYADNTFKAEKNISRAEFLKMFLLSSYNEEDNLDEAEDRITRILSWNSSSEITFSDVSKDDWFFRYLQAGINEKFISGYPDGSFKPHDFINFAEAAKIIGKEVYCPVLFKEKKYENWFTPYIQCLESFNVIGYKPDEILNRGQVADILARVYSMEDNIEGVHKGLGGSIYRKNIYDVFIFANEENLHNSKRILIEGVNPQTFTVINSACNLGVDENYFYKKNILIHTSIDKESYETIEKPLGGDSFTPSISVYGKDKNMFYDCETPQPIVDVRTVELLPAGLYKDKNNVFFNNKKLEKLDSKTFIYINNLLLNDILEIYGKDKNGYYIISKIEKEIVVNQLKIGNDKEVYNYIEKKRDKYIYLNTNEDIKTLKDIDFSSLENIDYDKDSLVYLSDKYIKDKNNVYVQYYDKDKRKKIFKILENVDVQTFKVETEIISTYGEFYYSSDKNNLYYNGEIVENINIDELEILGNKFFKDSDSVYTSNGVEIKNADSDTFEPLLYFTSHTESYLSKDKNNIYFGSNIFIKKESLEKEGLSLDDFVIISNAMGAYGGAHLYYRIGKKYYHYTGDNEFLEKSD